MTSPEIAVKPVARIITNTPIRVWSAFMLLARLGGRRWRASTLNLRLRLRQALKKLARVQSASRSLANQD